MAGGPHAGRREGIPDGQGFGRMAEGLPGEFPQEIKRRYSIIRIHPALLKEIEGALA